MKVFICCYANSRMHQKLEKKYIKLSNILNDATNIAYIGRNDQ